MWTILIGCCLCLPGVSWGSELRESPIVKAVREASPSIVNIRGEKTLSSVPSLNPAGPNDGTRRVNGMGTGVVIDSRGYIITNYHVVDGVKEIQVTLASTEKHVAKLIARDMETDLALIKIDARDPLPVISLGTSSDLMTGESVIAVGNAYGYEHTVTRGIVSALHRAVQVSDAQFYDDLIQTDASINPGNSGGPLLNIDGEMIGINVAVRAGAQGIGFAIPVDKVIGISTELMAAFNQKHALHGVTLVRTSGGEKQVKVAAVEPESPAAEAGLEVGDVIDSIGDLDLQRPLDFQRSLLEHKAGDKLKLSVHREGEKVAVSLELGPASKESKVEPQPAWDVLGLELKPVPADDFRQMYQTQYRGGLMVTAVRPDSPANKQGIRRGDVLVGMHVWETISLENVAYILSRPEFSSTPLKFFILRGSETLYGFLAVAKKDVVRQ
jgi:serine protease Do